MKKLLVTGSAGLIGTEVCLYFSQQGFKVIGIDNDQRASLFGSQASVRDNMLFLSRSIKRYEHHDIDIRDRAAVLALVKKIRPSLIVHAAAQPSHDLAAKIPFDDFDINATGTINLLESARQSCPEAPFVFMSTNKVYGDGPNHISLQESDLRWDYDDPLYAQGISENFPIDQCKHSLFGASKLAADMMVQEYGRYFNMPTCTLRGGCLTGPLHKGVELHGFLSYLVKCNIEEKKYTIFGYGGKQVRDNIHSYDVALFIYKFYLAPRAGAVYNIGGGKENSCSILEAFELVEKYSLEKQLYEYSEQPRAGDHICYYSDLSKVKRDYKNWNITISLDEIIKQLAEAYKQKRS